MKHALQTKKSLFVKLITVTSLVLLLLAMSVTTAFAKSQAAATPAKSQSVADCYYNPSEATCDGVDPQDSGCSADAYTQATANVSVPDDSFTGVLELRYSPHCGTNWARYISSGPTNVATLDLWRCSVAASNGTCPDAIPEKTVRNTVLSDVTLVWSPMLYAYVKGAQARIAKNCVNGRCWEFHTIWV